MVPRYSDSQSETSNLTRHRLQPIKVVTDVAIFGDLYFGLYYDKLISVGPLSMVC